MSIQGFKSSLSNYGAIILPFEAKWHRLVTEGDVKAVFRKKGPSLKAAPEWVYAYCGAPISAICAKLEITEILRVTVEQATEYCEAGHLSEAELREYAGENEELTVFRIGRCILAKHAVGMDELRKKFGFQPTPSFVALSDDGIRQLDAALKIKGAS